MIDERSQADITKRIAIFTAATFGILVLWNWMAPRPVPPPPDSTSASAPQAMDEAPALPGTAAATEAATLSTIVGEASPRRMRARTSAWDVEISNVGGRLTSWKLIGQGEYGAPGSDVELVHRRVASSGEAGGDATRPLTVVTSDEQDFLPLQVVTGDARVDATLARAVHVISSEDLPGARVLKASWSDGAGLSIEKVLTLREDPPVATIEAHLVVGGAPAPFWLSWGPGFANHLPEDQRNLYFKRGMVAYWSNGKVRTVERADKAGDVATRPVAWASIEDSYFAVIAVPSPLADASPGQEAGGPNVGFRVSGTARLTEKGKPDKKTWPDELRLEIPFSPQQPVQGLVIGPRDRKTLAGLSRAFRDAPPLAAVVDMGMFESIALVLHSLLLRLHELCGSWGVAILLLTLVVRIVVAPLQFFGMKKMRGMQQKMKPIQGRQKALAEKYRKLPQSMENRQKLMEERNKLMQEAGVNPMDAMSGCLPMLISMPVFFAMLRLLPSAPEFRHQSFLWWSDLAAMDSSHVLPILAGILTLVSTKMSMTNTEGMDPMQKNLLYVFPLMLVAFCWSATVGFNLYQAAMSAVQIGQTALFNLILPPLDAASTTPARPDGRAKGDPSPAAAVLSGGSVTTSARKKGRKR